MFEPNFLRSSPTGSSGLPGNTSVQTHHLLIVEQIRRMIRDGVLKEGDALPSERELAEHFGVSRVPVREAVKILEFIGVLHRDRTRLFVSRFDIGQTLNQFSFLFVNTQESVDELFEVRQALEVQSAISAASRRTEQDLIRIEDCYLETQRAIQLGRDAATPAIRFHYAIAQAAKNYVLLRMFECIFDLQVFYVRASMRTSERLDAVQKDHLEIYESIKARDVARAESLMREHMDIARIKARDAVLYS